MKLPNELVGLSAEYAVACELCRRNIYAQLTLGNRKRTDILLETDEGMARIQVKGKTGPDWPRCKGIFRENDLLVFVDFQNKSVDERPDFYILYVADWKKLLKKEIKLKFSEYFCEYETDEKNKPIFKDGNRVTINKELSPIFMGGNGHRIYGHNITPTMIVEHEGRWDKIKKRVGETE
jgi:hypothetical protein